MVILADQNNLLDSIMHSGENPHQQGQNPVLLKLANFWMSQPVVWFKQAKAQFHTSHITTDATKNSYLDQGTIPSVNSFVTSSQQ